METQANYTTKIKIEKTEKTVSEIEIQLPFFGKHPDSGRLIAVTPAAKPDYLYPIDVVKLYDNCITEFTNTTSDRLEIDQYYPITESEFMVEYSKAIDFHEANYKRLENKLNVTV